MSKKRIEITGCSNCQLAKKFCPLWLADLTKDGELINNSNIRCKLLEESMGVEKDENIFYDNSYHHYPMGIRQPSLSNY